MAGTWADGTRARGGSVDLGWDASGSPANGPRKNDWKRWFLVLGLGALSWVATFVGMLELIEANVGDLSFSHRLIIGFSVAMLMVMVVWLLDQIFSEISWATRLLYVGGYIFLTTISVGFGFGFYWKVLESRGEASRSAEAAVGQVQTALHAAATRLEQLQGTLDTLTVVSSEKATLERERGTSCPNSRPGDGPRRQLRDDDASRFKFAADFVKGRVAGIRNELSGLNGDLAKVVSNDRSTVDATSGTRNEYMRSLNRRLDMTVAGFNTFRSDPQLRQIRADLAERGDRVSFPDSRGGTFQCPDAQLSAALRGVVRAIDELPSLEKPKIAAVEGSEAVIEAFRRLSASLFGLMSLKRPPSAEELRELQKRAVQSVEASPAVQARLNAMAAEVGLSKRDYIPLAIALFVDLCLLLVSIKRPARSLDRLVPKMRAAEQGPVIEILSRFNEIHRDREIRENFEVFRHVVFDFHGDYYAAVPLNAPYRANPRNGRQMQGYGVAEAETLLQEAHLLANLFTSFEKEKIFSRVMSPLLTTATIQKRLRRQGSKFANAEAFRVYRFRDGAWSEIILGAVMGAARRAEGERRRRQFEEDLSRVVEPDLSPPRSPGAMPRFAHDDGPLGGSPDPRDYRSGRHAANDPTGSPRSRPAFTPRLVPVAGDDVGDSSWSIGSDAYSRRGVAKECEAGPTRSPETLDRRSAEAPAGENVVPHPVLSRAQSQGAGAEAAAVPEPAHQAGTAAEADRVSRTQGLAADGNSGTVAPPSSTPNDHGYAVPVEPAVTVSVSRESLTYSLPVSEARLPPSLLARGSLGRGAVVDAVAAVSAATAKTSAPLQVAAGDADHAAEHQQLIPATPGSEAQDELRSIALRFGPQTREGGHA